MNTQVNTILKNGKALTPISNVKSFVKQLEPLSFDVKQDILKELFGYYYEKGDTAVFNSIRNEVRIQNGIEPPNSMEVPSLPRGWFGNVIRTPNGTESILIGDTIYLKPKQSQKWTAKGGKKYRKHRKTRRHRIKKH